MREKHEKGKVLAHKNVVKSYFIGESMVFFVSEKEDMIPIKKDEKIALPHAE